MNRLKVLSYLLLLASMLMACEKSADNDDDEKDNDKQEAKLEAKVTYGGETYTFDLTGDELPDNVVFLSHMAYFKATNKLNQVLHFKLAAPSIHSSRSGVFAATPEFPDPIDDRYGIIQFYDPNEQPLTVAATKYATDDELVVSEFTDTRLFITYDGDAITGSELNNGGDEPFNLKLELSYTNFNLTDLR